MFSFFLPLLRVLFSSFSLQAESSESLDTRNCIFYENIEHCEAPKCERVVPALDPEWNTLAGTVEALCLSYIYVFFLKFSSLQQRPGTGTVFCLHSWEFWGAPWLSSAPKGQIKIQHWIKNGHYTVSRKGIASETISFPCMDRTVN